MVVVTTLMTAKSAQAQSFGLAGGIGVGLPTGGAAGAVTGVTSLVFHLRATAAPADFVQLGLGLWGYFPGVDENGLREQDSAGAAMAEARFFPIRLGSFRPYVGVGVGYAVSAYSVHTCDFLCSTRDVAGPNGVMLSPIGGLRFDFPPRRRLVSLYAEAGYQKTFSSPAALDRVFVQFGPGIEF
jgi:hypothetical protein